MIIAIDTGLIKLNTNQCYNNTFIIQIIIFILFYFIFNFILQIISSVTLS